MKTFPWATFNAGLLVVAVVFLTGAAIKRFGKYTRYIYAADASGKPTGKPTHIEVCTFGAPKEFKPA